MSSFIPPYTPGNILVGLASCWVQPYSMTTPAALPADTAALGAAWPSPWVPVGATDSGLEFDFNRKTNDIRIEEQVVKVDVETTDLSFEMQLTLAEDSLSTMKLAFGGGTLTATAAATGVPGKQTLVIATDMADFAFGFETKNEYGMARRVLVPRCKSVGTIKTMYSRAKDKRMYQTSFQSLVAPELVQVVNITAAAL